LSFPVNEEIRRYDVVRSGGILYRMEGRPNPSRGEADSDYIPTL